MASQNKTASAETGSPTFGEPEYLEVGFVRRPHGVKGDVLMDIRTDFPERLKTGLTVYVGEQYQPMVIANLRPHAKGVLVRFSGVKNPEEAGLYRNTSVFVPMAGLPELPEGEYYHHQLLGLNVITDDGRELGALVDILETGANDVYTVRDADGTEILLPAIPPVILDISLVDRQMRVHLLDGLI